MHRNLLQLQDIVADLWKEPWIKAWPQVFSSRWWKDWFGPWSHWFHFVQIFWKWGSLKGLQVKCSNPCFSLVFELSLMNPENNPGFSMKGMALAGRPEPHGQRKCNWVAGQSLAGLPSDRTRRAHGLMCGAFLNLQFSGRHQSLVKKLENLYKKPPGFPRSP